MLLVGQPKSGSTALLFTIAEIAKLKPINGRNWVKSDKECPGWEETQKYHHTTVQRTKEYITNHITNRVSLYKEHILPIDQHIQTLKEAKDNFVVLLRDPLEIVDCYRRIDGVLKLNFDYDALYKEVNDFFEAYLCLDSDYKLVVTYKAIVTDFHKTMRKILKHYGLSIPKDLNKMKLLKKNYTGVGLRRINANK